MNYVIRALQKKLPRAPCPLIRLRKRLKWTLLPKERYGNLLSGRGSNTQPSMWEAFYHWATTVPASDPGNAFWSRPTLLWKSADSLLCNLYSKPRLIRIFAKTG